MKDQAKAGQCKDTDMEESPIESTNANDWEDVVDTDDIPTNHIYILTLPPYKQQYSRHNVSHQYNKINTFPCQADAQLPLQNLRKTFGYKHYYVTM